MNISSYVIENTKKFPEKTAAIFNDGESIRFDQLGSEIDRFASFFVKEGIGKGTRVATFVRPSLSFVPCVYALFKIGAVPVFIDPGMKPGTMLNCIREASPQAMIGVPLAHWFRLLFASTFESVKTRIVLSKSNLAAALTRSIRLSPTASDAEARTSAVEPTLEVDRDTLAAIIFTSGSTGIPKGVEVTHGILDGQRSLLKDTFNIQEDDIDLVPFPLFALFSAAWGITCVIPDMNPAKPAKCSGKKLARIIEKYGVTHTAGSPAIWKNLFSFCKKNGIVLESLRRILMAGAPVPEKLLKDSLKVLPKSATVHTPYGATEALPVSTLSTKELLEDCSGKTREGHGTCVGRPLKGVKIEIIPIHDEPIRSWKDIQKPAQGEIGEIAVQGPLVTASYFHRPQANRRAKIPDPDAKSFWHRMGDLGYFDTEGRLWFCGRKDHRVQMRDHSLYPVQCEGVFNQHDLVSRTALVGIREDDNFEKPILIVEPMKKVRRDKLEKDLLEMAKASPLTRDIDTVLFKENFPVDVRHNIKINRPALSRFARQKVTR